MAIKSTEEALRELLTAVEIIEINGYPIMDTDYDFLMDTAESVRAFLISSGTFPWKKEG